MPDYSDLPPLYWILIELRPLCARAGVGLGFWQHQLFVCVKPENPHAG